MQGKKERESVCLFGFTFFHLSNNKISTRPTRIKNAIENNIFKIYYICASAYYGGSIGGN